MKALRALTVCLFLAAAAFADGPDTDPASATSTSTVTLIIPGLVFATGIYTWWKRRR